MARTMARKMASGTSPETTGPPIPTSARPETAIAGRPPADPGRRLTGARSTRLGATGPDVPRLDMPRLDMPRLDVPRLDAARREAGRPPSLRPAAVG